MRDRPWRRLVDTDRGQRHTTVDATGSGVRNWLRRHIVGIIGVALVAVLTGWLNGFFDSILHDVVPSGAEAACALRETIEYHWPFAAQPTPSDRFTILIARIDHDDADHTYTRAVERAFFKKDGIDRIETCRVLRLGAGRDEEITTVTTARRWLERRHADLLIGGEMLKKEDAVYLWFIDKDQTHDLQASKFRLDANLLKTDFAEAASTELYGVALAASKPATEMYSKYLVEILKPVSERLRHLLEASTGFTETQNAQLQQVLGFTLSVIGVQAGDNNALADAAKAYRAALEKTTRDRVPLDWAAIQNDLGNTLAVIGERESGTARLEEAVTAYHAALEEWTRDRAPLEWARAQNNLGTALGALGDRESGTSRLEEAAEAFGEALEEWTLDLVPRYWAIVQNNLGGALVRLGERESGESRAARFQKAIAALQSALEQLPRKQVPLLWAAAQMNLGTALSRLGERQNGESGIALLQKAVAAFRAAFEEETRDRVPHDWAMAQNNYGGTLLSLGELKSGESGIALLQEAVAALDAALSVFIAEGDMYDVALTRGNYDRAAALLAARRRAQ
jgi:tetratricopeptide (TPR) repeat protein